MGWEMGACIILSSTGSLESSHGHELTRISEKMGKDGISSLPTPIFTQWNWSNIYLQNGRSF